MIDVNSVADHQDEIGVLSGEVYILPYHRNPDRQHRVKAAVRDIVKMISSYRTGSGIEYLRLIVERKLKDQGDIRIISASYELYRTGELVICTSDEDPPHLAKQIYYFIKDTAHRHYHHRRASDNILPLTPIVEGDDRTWRRNTLWCLARSVLEARRRDKLDGYKSAIGMLAYAEAFQGLLGKVYRDPEDRNNFLVQDDAATYDFAHTKSSLEAKIGEHEYRINAATQISALFISSIIACVALWISSVQIKSEICAKLSSKTLPTCAVEIPHYAAISLSFAIQRPHWIYGAVLMAIMIYLGRKSLIIWPHAVYSYTLEAYSQNFGADISRFVNRKMPSVADRIGAYTGAAIAILIGAALAFITLKSADIFIHIYTLFNTFPR